MLEPRVFLSADCGCSAHEGDYTVLRDPSAAPQAPWTVEAGDSTAAAQEVTTQVVVSPQASSSDSSTTTPTGWLWYHGVDAAFLAARTGEGWRMVDIEVESTDPNRYSAAFVNDAGVYDKAWWWYYGLTSAEVSNYVGDNNARIVDIESYVTGGSRRYAVIMISNSGADAKGWWWYFNVTPAQVNNFLDANNARLVDIDEHTGGLVRTFDVVMVDNTGAAATPWWYYYNQTPAQIGSLLSTNDARLVDIEEVDSGHFDVIMERTSVSGWWWYYGATEAGINERASQNGARIFHIEPYFVSGQKRFAALMVNNSNAIESRVGEILRDASATAESGLYLKRVGGPVLAGLQENNQFEPASMIKALLNLTAMRQVQANNAELTDPLFMYYDPADPYASFNNPGDPDECPDAYAETTTNRVTLTLQQQLEMMMERSDNRATETIDDRFGRPLINATAATAGMADTAFASRIGCGVPGNFLTLADAGRMYEGVLNNTLLNAANAATFFRLMTDDDDSDREQVPFGEGVFGPFQTVVRQEAADLLNRPQSDPLVDALADAFIAEMRGAWKGGSYTLSAGTDWNEVRTAGGYVGLPFRNTPGETTIVNYVYGIYLEGALVPKSNPTPGRNLLSAAWSDSQGELLRAQIRAALATWRVNPAVSINNVAVTEGDAGTVNATFTLTLSGGGSDLPVRVNYATSNGTASSGADYVGESGFVTFTPGVATRTVTVAVRGDTLDENNETFSVLLSSPVNATIADGTGTATINDDDAPPTVSVQDVRGAEGNAGTVTFTFTVTTSAPSAKTVTVTATTAPGTASAGSDYVHATTQLIFNPGETSKTFSVSVNGDTVLEPDEQFTVNLSNPTNATLGDAAGVGTILNDDNPSPPTVVQVYLSSTAWAAGFKSYLESNFRSGSAEYGYGVPHGAAQLNELPWVTVDEISIRFSQDVLVQADDLTIRGVNFATYPTDAALYHYDAAGRTARWRLPAGSVLPNDKILLDLNADGPDGVRTAAGVYLDGNWANGADTYPSGDGAAGGDFRFRLNLLPGDTTGDGVVLAQDYADVKKRFFKDTTSPVTGGDTDYSPFFDLDGSGNILARDYAEVKKNFFDSLPAGDPAAPAAAASAAAPFASQLIRPRSRSRLAADVIR